MLPVLVELMLVLWLALLLWHSKLLLALDSCSCEADPRSRSRGRRKMAAGGCLPLSGVVSLALKCPMEKLPSSLSPVSGYSMVASFLSSSSDCSLLSFPLPKEPKMPRILFLNGEVKLASVSLASSKAELLLLPLSSEDSA